MLLLFAVVEAKAIPPVPAFDESLMDFRH